MKTGRLLLTMLLLWGVLNLDRPAFGQQTRAATTIGPEKGYLILQGGGASVPEIFDQFVALAGGAKARIVLIPTATAYSFPGNVIPPERLERMKSSMKQRMGLSDVTVLHTLDRNVADSEKFVESLRQATGVWLLGGDEGVLSGAYKGTRTERELDAVVARGGVVGGTSAGADIWAPYIFVLPPGMEEVPINNMGPYLKAEGFGLIKDVVVLPHFSERKLEIAVPKVLQIHPGVEVLGIDEDTAIVVHENSFEVMGRGGVSVYDGKGHDGKDHFLLTKGGKYDLAKRAVSTAASAIAN
jgi:cyanophycinase